jgi:hypothetical protein
MAMEIGGSGAKTVKRLRWTIEVGLAFGLVGLGVCSFGWWLMAGAGLF